MLALPATGQGSPTEPWSRAKWVRTGGVVAGSMAIAAAAVVSAGAQLASSPTALAKPTATVSGASDPATLDNYLLSLAPAGQAMGTALQNLSSALQATNWPGVNAGCQQLAGSAQKYQASLPSPDSRVTARIQRAADDINKAVNICMTWVPGSQPDVNQLTVPINDARAEVKSAQLIIWPIPH